MKYKSQYKQDQFLYENFFKNVTDGFFIDIGIPEDFERAGLDTDDVLRLADEKRFIDWVNNSWFDLYCYGEHLDCVSHELSEAISFAKTYVGDRWIEAEEFMR